MESRIFLSEFPLYSFKLDPALLSSVSSITLPAFLASDAFCFLSLDRIALLALLVAT